MRRAHEGIFRTLGLAIKVAREDKQLTTRALAEKAAVSPSTIFMIESGRQDPSFGTLMAIARALQTDFSTLLSVAGTLNADRDLQQLEKKRLKHKDEEQKLTQFILEKANALLRSSEANLALHGEQESPER